MRPGVDPAAGNMEGKEVRFGLALSALFAAVTTGLSDGAVNAMHDSFTPLGGLVPLVLIQLGEVLPGGVGSGLYGMLVFAIIAVFVAGPDGRAHAGIPRQEDRGAGDEDGHAGGPHPAGGHPRLLRGRARAARRALAGLANAGPHGLSEILYAYSSAAGNNGSAFARPHRQHALVQHDAGHRHAGSAASPTSCR